MSHGRMSASSVAHKSTGGTLQSLPEPVDPVGDAPDYLTFKTVAPLHQRVFDRRKSRPAGQLTQPHDVNPPAVTATETQDEERDDRWRADYCGTRSIGR